MEKLLSFIRQYTVLDRNTEKALMEGITRETFQKNEFLLKPGQLCHKAWFITSGLTRRYYLHDDREITVWIYYENQWITSPEGFFQQNPSTEYIQTLEPCEVLSLSRAVSQQLLEYPALRDFSKLHLQEMLACTEKFTREFTPLSARQKYDYLVQHATPIVQRAKLGHVASLMGVAQETLSRVRRQAAVSF